MKDFYWAEKRLDKDIASSLIDAISDSSYAHPIDTTGKVGSICTMYAKQILRLQVSFEIRGRA